MQKIRDALRQKVRFKEGPNAQSVCGDHRQPAPQDRRNGGRGYDTGKKIDGRKRHIIVDTSGLLLVAAGHAANVQGRDGAKRAPTRQVGRFGRLQRIRTDGGYAGQLIEWRRQLARRVLEIGISYTF